MPLPPWLNVNPSDFLRAMQAGTAAGEAAARTAQAQWEAEQRLKLEEQRIEAARQQNKAQLDALTAYRTGELGLGQQRLEAEKGRTAEIGRHNLMEEALGSKRVEESIQRAKEAQDARAEGLDLRARLAGLAERRAADAENKSQYRTDMRGNIIEIGPQGPKQIWPLPKEEKPSGGTSSLLTAAMMGASPFAYMGQKSIPPTPTAPLGPPAPRRLRVKGPNGQKGTVPEGSDLPEGWSLE